MIPCCDYSDIKYIQKNGKVNIQKIEALEQRQLEYLIKEGKEKEFEKCQCECLCHREGIHVDH